MIIAGNVKTSPAGGAWLTVTAVPLRARLAVDVEDPQERAMLAELRRDTDSGEARKALLAVLRPVVSEALLPNRVTGRTVYAGECLKSVTPGRDITRVFPVPAHGFAPPPNSIRSDYRGPRFRAIISPGDSRTDSFRKINSATTPLAAPLPLSVPVLNRVT